MIRIWAVLFGLAVAYAAALMVTATFAKAAQQLERNVEAGPADLKTISHDTLIAATGEQDHD